MFQETEHFKEELTVEKIARKQLFNLRLGRFDDSPMAITIELGPYKADVLVEGEGIESLDDLNPV